MKPLLLWLIVAAAVALTSASECDASEPIKISVQTGVASQHLFTDGTVLYARPVEQTAILAKLPFGLMAGVWQVAGLDDMSLNSNGGDELAVGAGWGTHTEDFMIEVGVKHHANAGVRGQTTIPEFEVDYCARLNLAHILKLYGNAEFPISHGHVVTELSAGAEHVWRILSSVAIRHRASGQFNSSAHGHSSVLLGVYRFGVVWSLVKREHISLNILGPTVRIYVPLTESHGYAFQQAYGATAEISWN